MDLLFDIFRVDSGWQAFFTILDMTIVFIVIYRVLLLIKGTRALQMLFGLIFILIFFYISQEDYLNLATTHWLIDMFIANLIIIVVIIFQHDIRRALAQVGRAPILGGARSYEETSVLEEVVKACVMLSSRKLGALIAIEREADLSHFTEEGIKLDAVVTKDVLFTLFLPEHQNPLHDGAVIIQKGRVSAAGCFLPLTINPRVEKTLGTRHRAGIGVTEDTDAAVAIVSEETGTISIAYEGELHRDLDANEMRSLLQKIYRAGTSSAPAGSLFERLKVSLQDRGTPAAPSNDEAEKDEVSS
ncbi:TIGR00159 family protein [Bradymonadaceae bacterium TMQ3]|uniref:Diadenylate cyclase n=1 Tax=Lujinxingia sediminis TaxID=2480984 RepID=A0ABY0CST0_9DELT|nr:diadenylate cyclase CdaA [Lujinxingia sediminis]RDV38853.1 TIGR00159 family protein [Bradymonadaceae bacterium TMQ3]RVU44087.1 TIGR00159 family protein [Lujinxingia sediminis]TXC76375.1 TIGR00159 family protein [Bradymonadales bacterium TMQ1]